MYVQYLLLYIILLLYYVNVILLSLPPQKCTQIILKVILVYLPPGYFPDDTARQMSNKLRGLPVCHTHIDILVNQVASSPLRHVVCWWENFTSPNKVSNKEQGNRTWPLC